MAPFSLKIFLHILCGIMERQKFRIYFFLTLDEQGVFFFKEIVLREHIGPTLCKLEPIYVFMAL